MTRAIVCAVFLALCTVSLTAQCQAFWMQGFGIVGANAQIRALTSWDADGPGGAPAKLVCGGLFTSMGGMPANGVAAFDPVSGSWLALGSGVAGGSGQVLALAALPGGQLVAAGSFTSAGGVPAQNIAVWDGASWAPLGAGFNSTVWALQVMPNGDLIAGGQFTWPNGDGFVARWDGTNWSSMAVPPWMKSTVMCFAVKPSGELYAGGYFSTPTMAGRIARWNGANWSQVGGGVGPLGHSTVLTVLSIVPLQNGDILVAGWFQSAGGVPASNIARFNGTLWTPLGTGTNGGVASVVELANGDLIAGGGFVSAGGVASYMIARWNGTAWSALGAGCNGTVHKLLPLHDGDIVVGGEFSMTDNRVAGGVSMLGTSCTARAEPLGSGCGAPTSHNYLVPASAPRLGGLHRTVGYSMTPNGLALVVTGLSAIPQTSLPLSSIFVEALPACDLLVAPLFLDVAPISSFLPFYGGYSVFKLTMPTDPSSVGLVFYQQFISLNFTPTGTLSTVTATNALSLKLGPL